MAYSRHEWETGDVVSVARLNNIEDGVEASSRIEFVSIINNSYLDKTYNEIVEMLESGILPILRHTSNNETRYHAFFELYHDGSYAVCFSSNIFFADSPDGLLYWD